MDSIWIWVAFNVFVLAMLALDLGVFHRGSPRSKHAGSSFVECGVDWLGNGL